MSAPPFDHPPAVPHWPQADSRDAAGLQVALLRVHTPWVPGCHRRRRPGCQEMRLCHVAPQTWTVTVSPPLRQLLCCLDVLHCQTYLTGPPTSDHRLTAPSCDNITSGMFFPFYFEQCTSNCPCTRPSHSSPAAATSRTEGFTAGSTAPPSRQYVRSRSQYVLPASARSPGSHCLIII